jgi:hypothetical protein
METMNVRATAMPMKVDQAGDEQECDHEANGECRYSRQQDGAIDQLDPCRNEAQFRALIRR